MFAFAIQTGIIMVHFIRQALANRAGGKPYMESVIDGAVLRPKLMTVGATVVSLFPIMFSPGAGMEIMKPIVALTIGGMIKLYLYELLLIPCLFAIGNDSQRNKRKEPSV